MVALFQVEGVRRGPRRVHADVRAVPVSGDPPRTGDLDRARLRSGGERLRVQAEEFGKRLVGGPSRAKLLNVRRTRVADWPARIGRKRPLGRRIARDPPRRIGGR